MLEDMRKKTAEMAEKTAEVVRRTSEEAKEAIDAAGKRMTKSATNIQSEVESTTTKMKAGGVNLWHSISRQPSDTMAQIMQGKPRINRHLVYNPQEMCSWKIFRAYHGTVLADRKIWMVAGGLLVVAASSTTAVFLFCP